MQKPDNTKIQEADNTKIQEVFASLDAEAKKIKEKIQVKADSMDGSDKEGYDSLCCAVDNIYRTVDYLRTYLYDSNNQLWNALYEHKTKGHLPPILGADKMEKALKSLGIDKDYNVEKPTIWVSASKKGQVFEVDLGKFNKN